MKLLSYPLHFAGQRFPTARDEGAEEDVASEHEDQANCPWHYNCSHPYHNSVCVPWLQMQVIGLQPPKDVALILYTTATCLNIVVFGYCIGTLLLLCDLVFFFVSRVFVFSNVFVLFVLFCSFSFSFSC